MKKNDSIYEFLDDLSLTIHLVETSMFALEGVEPLYRDSIGGTLSLAVDRLEDLNARRTKINHAS
jgi:hypothetical protein